MIRMTIDYGCQNQTGVFLMLEFICRYYRVAKSDAMFHLGCAIGKRLMSYLQGFSLRQSRSFQAKLFSMLDTCWSPGVLCLRGISKSFSQLLGVEIKAFVLKYPEIFKFLSGKLTHTKEVLALSEALTLWYNIERFL